MKLSPNIKDKILRESKRRREKRIRIPVTDEEHALLLAMSIEEDLGMGELIRKKIFGGI